MTNTFVTEMQQERLLVSNLQNLEASLYTFLDDVGLSKLKEAARPVTSCIGERCGPVLNVLDKGIAKAVGTVDEGIVKPFQQRREHAVDYVGDRVSAANNSITDVKSLLVDQAEKACRVITETGKSLNDQLMAFTTTAMDVILPDDQEGEKDELHVQTCFHNEVNWVNISCNLQDRMSSRVYSGYKATLDLLPGPAAEGISSRVHNASEAAHVTSHSFNAAVSHLRSFKVWQVPLFLISLLLRLVGLSEPDTASSTFQDSLNNLAYAYWNVLVPQKERTTGGTCVGNKKQRSGLKSTGGIGTK